jgi:hypothetical protein
VWFNLHKRRWSIKDGKSRVHHADAVALAGVSFRVSEKARQRVIAGRCREVHAYAAGALVQADAAPAGAVLVSYNPYRSGSFYRKDDGRDVHAAELVVFLPGGQAWAVNPT